MTLHLKKRNSLTSYRSLEDRRLLAGDVTVFESDHLYIRGDQADNQFEVVANGDQLEIKGLDGTTINGEDSYVVANTTVTESGVSFAGGLRAHLGPGHDDFAVRDAQFESLSVIYGGTGDDEVDIIDSRFMDRATIQTYDGNDSIAIDGSHFEDTFYAITLDGQDSVTMIDSMMAGNSIVLTGEHADSIHSDGTHYMGDVNLVLSLNGDDSVQLINPVVGEHQLGVFLGNGDDSIVGDLSEATIDGTIRIGGQGGVDEGSMEMGETTGSNVSVGTVEEMRTLVFDNQADDSFNIISSQNTFFHTENLNFRTADDVQVAETQNVSQISWTGTYGGDLSQEFPEPYEVDDFTIEIYEGTSDVPVGDPIGSFNVGNDVNRTDTGATIGPLGMKKVYSYSADIDATLEAGKTYWVSIYGQVQDDVGGGSIGGDFVTFQWASRGTYFGTQEYDTSSAYTYGDRITTNPGWFDNMGGFQDFQLWS